MEMAKDQIAALDIGTRTIVGVIVKQSGGEYRIVDHEITEHSERAMLDGQIHDIAKVTEAVVRVVERLTQRNGAIGQVAIAAAGRSLRTARAAREIDLDPAAEIDKDVVDRLEMLAIQLAQTQMSQSDPVASTYYTVGHSVVNYQLDGALILNPIGHRGSKLAVEVIATFLPHIVVDSLYSVLKRAGLGVLNLTLEPIAALNVAIPRALRLLNLALVDIGAGTSDIAISRDGTVHSYGMVASAGDRITEIIAQRCLLDFNAAEKLKIEASRKERCRYADILGIEHEIASRELLDATDEAAVRLAAEICGKILELNGRPPSAVFCIGGGSLLPGLREKIASQLGLAPERVAVKSVEQLERIQFPGEPLHGPEYITPIGIGVTAFEERDHDFIQVSVNELSVRLLNTKPLHVADALILAGFNARSLLSERGESIFVEIDGVSREIKGEFGDPAKILVNGERASLDSPVAHQDKITVYPAQKGLPRKVRLAQLVSAEDRIFFDGAPIRITEYVSVNGTDRTGDYLVIDGDRIETRGIKTADQLRKAVELADDFVIIRGDQVLRPESSLEKNERYGYRRLDPQLRAQLEASGRERRLTVTVNGRTIQVKENAIFVDLFDIIDFDRSRPQGMLCLSLNGTRASYMDALSDGDVVEIAWKQQ